MAMVERGSGIRIELPEDLSIVETGAATPAATTRTTRGRRPRPGADVRGVTPPVTDPVAAAMAGQDMVLVDSFGVVPKASGARTRRAAPAPPATLAVEVQAEEDAVVLLEHEGIYEWRFRKSATTIPATRRGPERVAARRTIEFDLSFDAVPEEEGRVRRRGPLTDFAVDKVRAYVFRFVARIAVGVAIDFLERKARTGLVHIDADDPKQWKPIERLDALELPTDRPARILLLVHGTFSTTFGSYGALGASEWGVEFLQRARSQYDAIIGYDHRTLSRDPLQNAEDLLGRLERTNAPALEIDAVAYSRGGLVLRSLIEYLLPASPLRARVKRAVFVAATNGGTELAARGNWERLIDLWTNMAAAASRVVVLNTSATEPAAALAAMILQQSIDSLGALVKALAAEVVNEEEVPGLAAMVPTGRFVTEINRTQPGQPAAADSLYYAVSSEFDLSGLGDGDSTSGFPARFARWAADALVDAAVTQANDLVVHVASMTQIDEAAGVFVKDRLELGRNPNVYHTVYFTRKDVVRALERWFGLDPAAARNVLVVGADEPLEDVLEDMERADPEFVVAVRDLGQGYQYKYAYRADELREDSGGKRRSASLEDSLRNTTLEMHEGTSSPESRDGGAPPLKPGSPSGERVIVLDGDTPTGVIDYGSVRRRGGGMGMGMGSSGGGGLGSSPGGGSPHRGGRRGARGGTTSPPPPSMPVSPAAAPAPAAKPRTGDIFVAAEMQEKIPLNVAVPLDVIVSQDAIDVTAGPASSSTRTTVDIDRTVLIHILPKRNLEIVGDDRFEVDPARPRTDLMFEVRGVAPGAGEVWVVVRQGPVNLATIKLQPQIGAAAAAPGRIRAAADVQPADDALESYPLLHISEWNGPDAFRYEFFLQLEGRQFVSGRSADIQVPRDQYVADLYKKIENRWLSTDQDFAEFQEELRAFGGTLLDELVPANIQDALWNVRDSLSAIQVVAEEPFIPWELVHLKPPRPASGQVSPLPDETHFLAQKGLVRWLVNAGVAPAGLEIRKGRSFYAIPPYADPAWALPEAQAEIAGLERLFGATPVEAKAGAITKLLRVPGQVDHFHFSGHGEADATKAVDAQLLISRTLEGGTWVPRYLSAEVVAQSARLGDAKKHRPLIVLNACQIGRAGWRLSSIGGFAHAFIHAGAGAFVGSLWSVGDRPARHFSEAFYESLATGHSLAEAAVAGRQAAAAAEDGTWLAYVVYGYPHAKLRVE